MNLDQFFVQIARDVLPAEVFEDIRARAVAAERKRVEQAPALPKERQIANKVAAGRVEAHLNSEPAPAVVPHAIERIEERVGLTIGPSDLGALSEYVAAAGPNVTLLKREMIAIGHYEVSWRGKHFVVVYNQSRQKLITAWPKPRKMRPGKKVKRDAPRRPGNDLRQMLHNAMGDDE